MALRYTGAAVADGTQPDLVLEQTIVVDAGRIDWMGDDGAAPAPGQGEQVVDAAGTTVIPGLVDAHSHTVLPGGAHWIARIDDATDDLLRVAEDNGALATAAGTRWFRDVGSPRRDGRALALGVRDAWRGRRDRPYIRAAGTWLAASGVLPPGVAVEVPDADALVEAVAQQIEEGADLVKLYLDGPDRETSPWTAGEVARCTQLAHDRGVDVTAHATQLAGARAAVDGGVDCVEHASHLDGDLVRSMADKGVFIVPTLGVLASFDSFASTTRIDRFTGDEGRTALAGRTRVAYASVKLAHVAGVRIAAGTDFGGGSLRANQMAWEIECLVEAGLEPWQALGAATHVGGDLLGEPDAGRLIAGGPADFFLVHGNPLDDPSALWRVWRVA